MIDAQLMRMVGADGKKKCGTSSDSGVHELLFSRGVWSQVDGILYDLILKVREDAEPVRNGNRAFINPPLMSTEYGKEDFMLATAFALGDNDLVSRIIELYPKHQLGNGLKKFTPKSIDRII